MAEDRSDHFRELADQVVGGLTGREATVDINGDLTGKHVDRFAPVEASRIRSVAQDRFDRGATGCVGNREGE